MMAQTPKHKNQAHTTTPNTIENLEVDVLIIGSGPVGCTFARKFVAAERSVYMIDAGAMLSEHPGEHLKNSFLYQRDVNPFASVIRGHLHYLSVPTNNQPALTLDPVAYKVDRDRYTGFVRNNQNPDQIPYKNLDGAAASYAVGGMGTHWTCACPRFHSSERTNIISDEQWAALYDEAEELLNVSPRRGISTHPFEHSIRHNVIREILQKEYNELQGHAAPHNLPLACERRTDNDECVHWSGADTVLGPLATSPSAYEKLFTLKEQHLCKKLVPNSAGTGIEYAVVENLLEARTLHIRAKVYVVAAGTVLTPQILYNSNIRPPAMGKYLSEQPMAFCQVVLKQSIVEGIATDPRFADRVKAHQKKNPHDPVPVPENDPEPQIIIPVSDNRPWHCQVHRDAFHYGDLAPNVDGRLIVDLRWFGIVRQRPENKVTFSDKHVDTFGMPQPSFEFSLDEADRKQQHAMMEDMLRAAGVLGGFLPGSEPQFMIAGMTLHIHGTTRLGDKNDGTSVVDPYSRVWGFDNLYLGGNGLIPVGSASNPTLTSVALAIRSADTIIRGGQSQTDSHLVGTASS
ncbi:MAG: pyranose oxidase [Ktedonobacteraceae bacterium]